MEPVTISDDAKALLRTLMGSSGFNRPHARIAMNMPEPAAGPPGDQDADWTIRRRDLWALRVEDGASIPEGDARRVVVDGLGFVCDFFPMRFDISAKDGHFRVAAAA
jgi:hypothetical protein